MKRVLRVLSEFLPQKIGIYSADGIDKNILLSFAVKNGIYLRVICEQGDCTLFEMPSRYCELLHNSSEFKAVSVTQKKGIAFAYRRRYGLLVGALIFVMLMLYLSSVLWCIDISGISRLNDDEVRMLLKECGVSEGVNIKDIDNDRIRILMMNKSNDIAWMSVNVHGTRAKVEILEAEKIPERNKAYSYSNIVAARDGVITEVTVVKGVALVFPGDTVKAGELLVTGIIEERDGDVSYTNAVATVIARTEREFAANVSLEQKTVSYGKQTFCGINVKILGKYINISNKYRLDGLKCDIIHKRGRLSLFDGFELPVEYVCEYCTPLIIGSELLTEKQAVSQGKLLVHSMMLEEIRGSVIAKRLTCKTDNNSVTVTLNAVCEEDISSVIPFCVTR